MSSLLTIQSGVSAAISGKPRLHFHQRRFLNKKIIFRFYRRYTSALPMKTLVKKMLTAAYKISALIESVFDKEFLVHDVPMSRDIQHVKWQDFLYAHFNKPGIRVLEIGSREVTGESEARQRFNNATYVGFDFYPGKNVDVVGDAHKLSTYFKEGEKFDLIYSSACFEHFAMPWLVAPEIAKLLKVGGHVFVETHFSYRSHERPWHFFQFSDMAMKTLFSEALGFECIEVGLSNPIVGRFSSLASDYLKNQPVSGLYCHVEYYGKKIRQVNDFTWDKVSLTDVVGATKYPEPAK